MACIHDVLSMEVYRSAADILNKLERKQGSLKSLVFSKKLDHAVGYRKQVYALVAETLKRKSKLSIMLYQ